MSQELTQELTGGGIATTGTTGSKCTETSLYKASDGKIEFIEYVEAGAVFPPFPGGKGTKSCTWTRLTLASDGGKQSFTAVKVAAGTI
jgi:hypothetical protein